MKPEINSDLDNDSPPRSAEHSESGSPSRTSGIGRVWQFFARKLRLSSDEEQKQEQILEDISLNGIAQYILHGKCKNIIVMAGAGISTSAGIPDFRSPGVGLYDSLREYRLPYPEAVFTLSFFRRNPEPFFALARELLLARFEPTPCHYFVRLLHEKGLLLRLYTQNVDTLERAAGLPAEKIVEAHGSFASSHCLGCRRFYPLDWMRERIASELVPKCTTCSAVVKPDIVFFGERLPGRFFALTRSDFSQCDLLIILGSSLVVEPFASLLDLVGKSVPRLLVNREKAGERRGVQRWFRASGGLDFDSGTRDVFWRGECDEGCYQLAGELGWEEELRLLVASERKKLDEEMSGKQPAQNS
ncbi:NAD-dependent protein deacetylase sirtuin-2-like [Bacillus rossius redtenbacheri]|uniref:NAD-dependent protein deacetylase sirtuin-2-like n=1 Tax=Bacillus rossius redtenbacheri TaxID=93214 RepID=UPI002FDF079D